MECVAGTVYERGLPEELKADLERQARMSRSLVEAIASIHNIRPETTDLSFLDGNDHVSRDPRHLLRSRSCTAIRSPGTSHLATTARWWGSSTGRW